MAIQWNWEKKVGFAIDKNGRKHNIYIGNAFLIFVYEFEADNEERYFVSNFYANKDHCKNCFGLNKDYEKIEFTFNEISLDISHKNCKEFIYILAKSETDITIRLINKPW